MHSAEVAPVHAPSGVQRAVLLFLVTFLLIFPKGGLKVAGVPITWGYLGLGMMMLWLPVALLAGRSIELRSVRLVCLALLVPFQLISWGALLVNGVGDVGFTLSFVTTFFVIPATILLVLGVYLDRLDLSLLLRAVRVSLLAVAIYGIFLFFYKLSSGSFIEIPYLTVNAGDVGMLETKHIDRGDVFKLISTYNNGNLYGVCILLLLPLYAYLEPRILPQSIVKASLVLTLSRTIWIGLIAYEVLSRLYVRRITWKTVALFVFWIVLALTGVGLALSLLGRDLSFIFDPNLGGRADQFRYLINASVLPREAFQTIEEMVYLSVLHNFGILGLVCFMIGMMGPLLLHLARFLPHSDSPYKRSLALGLIVYLIVAVSDGATLYIPVMAIYWFVASLLLSDNPSFVDFDSPVRAER